jgi:hypothetical protein
VVELPDEGHAPVLELLEHVDRPQRVRAVEPLLHRAGGDGSQLCLGHRRGDRQRTDVRPDIEIRVVNPRGRLPPPRARAQLAVQPRDPLDPFGDTGAQRLGVGSWSAPHGVEDRDLERVTRDRRGLAAQDRGVLRSEGLLARGGTRAALHGVTGDIQATS